MKKEQMVGTRLPEDLVRDLETIEHAEQSDRSTTVRKLLYRAVQEWKLKHYARLYGERKDDSCAGCPSGTRVALGNDGVRAQPKDTGAVGPRRSHQGSRECVWKTCVT